MENIIESTQKALVEGNIYAIPDSLLNFNLEFRDLECSRLLGKIVSQDLKIVLSKTDSTILMLLLFLDGKQRFF
jgi:hypothetical protein